MIVNSYKVDLNEFAAATQIFVEARPILKLLLLILKLSCLLLCFGFLLKCLGKQTSISDYIAIIAAISWLIFRKKINYKLLKFNLSKRKEFINKQYNYQITENKLWWQDQQKHPQYVFWRNIKYIYKTNLGFIIPKTGWGNAGKFIWLPYRGFADNSMKSFLELVSSKKIIIKNKNYLTPI